MATPAPSAGDRREVDSILVCLRYLSEEADRHGLPAAARMIRAAIAVISTESTQSEASSCTEVFCSEVDFLVRFNSAPVAIRQRFLRLIRELEKSKLK